jgi:hypothetical protein
VTTFPRAILHRLLTIVAACLDHAGRKSDILVTSKAAPRIQITANDAVAAYWVAPAPEIA